MTVSVAGNLLLTGEYFVTLPGGRGIAVAVEPRVIATASESAHWRFEAIMGSERIRWSPGMPTSLPLAEAVLREAEKTLHASGFRMPKGLSLVVDSSAFFMPDGRKIGFGSSAASAVAMALIVCKSAGLGGDDLESTALGIALRAHRAMQGGRGSGYDVYASMHGGFGVFSGGEVPTWKGLPFAEIPEASLLLGPRSVSSANAVAAFVTANNSRDASIEDLRKRMDEATARVESAFSGKASLDTASDFLSAMETARDAGIGLGRLIGFSAEPVNPPDRSFVKALGAGNEIALVIPATPQGAACEVTLPFRPSGAPRWS